MRPFVARVYVSSTSLDMADVREQVRLTLRRMDHEDVAMEYYVAEDIRPVDKCLQDVESPDVYILLLAWRYGHIPRDTTCRSRISSSVAPSRPMTVVVFLAERGGAVARQSI